MSVKEQYWRYSLIAIIIVLGIVLFQQITPFLGGLLGALTIYILVRKQMIRLTTKRKMKRSTAALLITTEAVFFFLIPISLVVWMLVDKLQNLNLDPQSIIAPIEEIAGIIKSKTGYDVLGSDTTSFIVSALPRIGQAVMGGISSFVVNLFVLVFVLYFMLIGGIKMEAYVNAILPFNATNTEHVIHEINMIVRSNAIGLAAYGGIIVSQLDNLIRFILQKKMADTHPLITIFGVVIGLSLFGFMGVIFGPLLLSLFFLFVDMFKREYLDTRK